MKNLTIPSLSLLLALAGVPTALHATPVVGTFGVNFSGVSLVPPTTGGGATPLDPVTGIVEIDYTGVTFSGTSSPGFPNPMAGVISGSTSLFPNQANGGNGTPFTLTFGSFGTFTESGNPILISETSTPETLALLLDGTFVPGVYFAGDTGGAADILVDLTESSAGGGTSYSASGTFAINPSSTPEPSGLILLGTGLLAAFATLRRRHTI